MADDWRTQDVEAMFAAILSLESREEAERFFRDLCTLNELRDMSQRWAVVRLLDSGMHYAEISRETGASTATITRIASWLNHGEGGYRGDAGQAGGRLDGRHDPLPRRRRAVRERLRLAIPNKGRMVEPTLKLLHDAGLIFDEHDRSLVARVQNYPLDILFVRTNDIIEFVGDGVADLGITGIDLLSETGAELPRIRELGYGRCRLAAAVPNDAPQQSVEDLAGLRVATAHPNTARRFFEERGIPVDVIPISGAVEVAPRLGLAEGIVDLVSTGSTLVMNGLRQIGDVLASEAVLIANPGADRERADRARRHRHHALGGHRRSRPQVPDDERPVRQAPGARTAAAGARVADDHPARAHRA